MKDFNGNYDAIKNQYKETGYTPPEYVPLSSSQNASPKADVGINDAVFIEGTVPPSYEKALELNKQHIKTDGSSPDFLDIDVPSA